MQVFIRKNAHKYKELKKIASNGFHWHEMEASFDLVFCLIEDWSTMKKKSLGLLSIKFSIKKILWQLSMILDDI